MNTKHSNEDLLYSLPDYISDNLTDTELKNAIEMKISSDPDFKMEFLNLTDTIDQFKPDLSEMPSDVYFNNLSVRINEAIYNESKPVSLIERFGFLFKIVLPVLAILTIITSVFIYMNSTDTGDKNIVSDNETKTENKITDSGKNLPLIVNPERTAEKEESSNYSEKVTTNQKGNYIEEFEFQKYEKLNIFTDNNKTVFSRDEEPNSGSLQATATDILAFAENSISKEDINENNLETENTESDQEYDILNTGDSDENFLEEDLFELTPEEQFEIVEFLKHS